MHYGVKGMRWGIRKDEDYSKKPDTSAQKKTKKLMDSRANRLNEDFKLKRIDIVLSPSYSKSGQGDKYLYMVRDRKSANSDANDLTGAVYFTPDQADELVDAVTQMPGPLVKMNNNLTINDIDEKIKRLEKERRRKELERAINRTKKAIKIVAQKTFTAVKDFISAGVATIKKFFSGSKD